MIQTIRHKGLKRFFDHDDRSKLPAADAAKIARVLSVLDMADNPQALNLPGYRLHPLKGNLKGFWSVVISRNFRIIFRFKDGDAYEVDLIDYH